MKMKVAFAKACLLVLFIYWAIAVIAGFLWLGIPGVLLTLHLFLAGLFAFVSGMTLSFLGLKTLQSQPSKQGEMWNTNNYRANAVLLFLYLAILIVIPQNYPDFFRLIGWKSTLGQFLWFIVSFAICTRWLGPDLDLPVRRRFVSHGKKDGAFLGSMHLRLLNALWSFFWWPFAFLVTHRGISHWPVVGTICRLSWVLLPIMAGFFLVLGIENTRSELSKFPYMPWVKEFIFAWVVADLTHVGTDCGDTLRKPGPARFCHQRHRRGAISKWAKLRLPL